LEVRLLRVPKEVSRPQSRVAVRRLWRRHEFRICAAADVKKDDVQCDRRAAATLLMERPEALVFDEGAGKLVDVSRE
jgi:hypothetical protein